MSPFKPAPGTGSGKVNKSGDTMTGQLVVPDLSVTGLTGATAASRYVGATASGAPTTGTFAVGDFVIDQTGKVWVCTTAGTPGTWTKVGGSSITTYAFVGSNVALPYAGTFQTVATSPSLPTGTYVFTGGVCVVGSGSSTVAAQGLGQLAVGTATATISGLSSSSFVPGVAAAYPAYNIPLSCVVTVTVAGTMILQAAWSDTANNGTGYGSHTGGVFTKVA
jgi:hypothetical protein